MSLAPHSEFYTPLSFFSRETYENSLSPSAAFIRASDDLSSGGGFGNANTLSGMMDNLDGACQPLKDDINGVCLEIVREVARRIRDEQLKSMRGKVRARRDKGSDLTLITKTARSIVFCIVIEPFPIVRRSGEKAAGSE